MPQEEESAEPPNALSLFTPIFKILLADEPTMCILPVKPLLSPQRYIVGLSESAVLLISRKPLPEISASIKTLALVEAEPTAIVALLADAPDVSTIIFP